MTHETYNWCKEWGKTTGVRVLNSYLQAAGDAGSRRGHFILQISVTERLI